MARRYKHGKYKKNHGMFKILILIFIILIIYSLFNIIKWLINNNKNNSILDEVSKSVSKEEYNNGTKYNVNFDLLKQMNEDVVGWIKVNNTKIEYPIVKTENNSFYLDHSFDKSSNNAGWVFMDSRNVLDGTDRNIVIYGHNRRDKSQFGSLQNVLDDNWYNNEENRYITFITDKNSYNCEIFSIYKIENEDYYIATDFVGNEFYNFIKTIKSRSIKDFNVEVSQEDKILTLSTCANNNKYRVVVHAKIKKM